ncbi:MAG: TolC family protein, partial [Acidiferrobacterales bacterium]
MKSRSLFGVLALGVVLTACATYHPKPLHLAPGLTGSVRDIRINRRMLPLPQLRAHRFDPNRPLDMTEVAMVAVVNNPQLRIARDDAGVAHAQAFAAGLLPDPQLSFSRDYPTSGPAVTSAFGIGLSYDVGALLVRSAIKGAATAEERKVDLNLLWQEWQVVSKARLLYVRAVEQKRELSLLRRSRALFAQRLKYVRRALRHGDATLDAEGADLVAVQNVDRQINTAQRRINRTRHDLTALLGLAPEAKLELAGIPALPPLNRRAVIAVLPDLARRRPDLLALRAGYQAQEERVREAILAQFPAISIGIRRSRDNTDVYSEGFGVSISLPIFNRNRGGIAVARATRRRLYDDFRLRLDTAYSQVRRILDAQRLQQRQLQEVNGGVAA